MNGDDRDNGMVSSSPNNGSGGNDNEEENDGGGSQHNAPNGSPRKTLAITSYVCSSSPLLSYHSICSFCIA